MERKCVHKVQGDAVVNVALVGHINIGSLAEVGATRQPLVIKPG